MGRARADRILRVPEVLFGRDRAYPVPVAVRQIEHRLGDAGPALHPAGTGQIVRAVPGTGIQQVEDRVRHIRSEREAPVLVVHHGHLVQTVPGVGDAVGQHHHGLYEVMALADHPARTQDIMTRAIRDRDVPGGLRLAVHAQRRERLLLVMQFGGPVEHVIKSREARKKVAIAKSNTIVGDDIMNQVNYYISLIQELKNTPEKVGKFKNH